MAITPANGPSPNKTTKIIAQMMLGKLRVAANRILVGTEIHNGAKFRAASGERMMAIEKPKTVATKAILMVSSIPM